MGRASVPACPYDALGPFRLEPGALCRAHPGRSRPAVDPNEESDPHPMTAFHRLGIAADHVNRHPAMRQEVLNIYPNAKIHDKTLRSSEDDLIEFLQGCDA